MKDKTFQKDVWRSIRHSMSRFLAIFAIVALGAGFYAGLGATAPDMRVTADQYCDEGNMMDIHLLSTLGFSQQDIDAIRQQDGVLGVMAGYSADFFSEIDGSRKVVRIHSLPENTSEDNEDYINRPLLVEGRMPEAPNECLLGISKLDQKTVGVGSKIVLQDEDGELEDTLKYSEYTVVGMVQSSYYLSFSLGSSTIGSGTIDHFMYVPQQAFSVEAYTDVFATVEGAAALNAFSQQYDDLVDPVIDNIEAIADERAQIRYDEVYAEATQELADAQAELDDAREEADQELGDAYDELMENQQKIEDGEREISENEQKLQDAAAEIESNNNRLRTIQNDFDASYGKYQEALELYNDGLAQYEEGLAGWQQLSELLQGYWQVYRLYQGMGLSDEEIAQRPLDPTGQIDPTGMTMGQAAQTLADQLGSADEAAQQTALAAMKQTLDDNKKVLDETGATLAENGEKLEAARTELANGWYSLNTAIEQLETGRQELEDARVEIADGKIELEDGWQEYNDAKAEADEKLADAQKELDDARELVDDLEVPDWYVLSRHTNVGFASYESDADRMASLSTVFPVLFFLVAALVALTTMTRMVEEERVIIGTYKALGYSSWRIISKYLLYALLASLIGSAIGIAIGLVALPTVCYNSYRILYTGPDLIIGLNLKYVIEGALAATACTMLSTYAACRSSLREPAASLLLPKAPKAGKRILLERIGFIWQRMKFTSKVTWRNIFRYKKRLIMTLVGIAGCTGLLLTGYGVRDSVSSILTNQYGKVYLYDTVIGVDGTEVSPELEALLEDTEQFSDSVLTAVKSADIEANGQTIQGYTMVPQSSLEGFIRFQTRDGDPVEFGSGSVVITEKAAKVLEVKVGDDVFIKDGDGKLVPFTITGITENYIQHYLYIDPALYEQAMGEAPEYNQVCAISTADTEEEQQALTDRLLSTAGVSTATFTSEISASFDDMLESLNYVILVIILCAGALAFVVVYNLTNINITERRRELATIKVLGFHRREVQNYIFRETNLLTLFGSIIGLGAGKLMHGFVIGTVEVDIVMFGRDIAPMSYLISFLLTNLFSQLVNQFMKRRLSKIDMVESLKSVD